jgi:hypothetical protein
MTLDTSRGSERRDSRWWACCLGLALIAVQPSVAAAPGQAQILYFEPLRLNVVADRASGVSQQKTSARDIRHLEVSAFGRDFTLAVETNETFHSLALKPSQSSLKLYRGEIQGIAGSWVRLGTVGTAVHGMLWDGYEAYVIAPSDEIEHQLMPPLVSQGGTVIFRLADVLVTTPEMACASDDAPEMQRASDAFDALAAEMQPAVGGATKRLELAALADADFLAQHGDAQAARDSVLVRMNIVDGIFSTQVGVQIQVPSVTVYTEENDPFSGTANGSALLEELSAVRRRTPALRSHGLTHLFTGRRLNGTTIGIGYVGALCDARYGAALTEVSGRGVWHEALVAAHEIGHNFGAVHDGQPGKACASTPQGVYLMSPNVNGNEQFSDCSLNSIRFNVQRAACIAPLPPANIGIAADLGTWRQPVGAPFDWTLPVVNRGGAAAFGVRADLTLPSSVAIEDAFVEGGTCLSGAGVIQCELGVVPGGASRSVNLRLRGNAVGAQTIAAAVSAYAEPAAAKSDNQGKGTLEIVPFTDIALRAEAPSQARTTESFELRFTLTNSGAHDVDTLRTAISLPAGLTASRAELAGGDCTIAADEIDCSLPTLQAGSAAAGTVRLEAGGESGERIVRLTAQGTHIDNDAANDTAEVKIEVVPFTTSSPQAATASRSGGGGGALNLSTLLLLLSLFALRFRR